MKNFDDLASFWEDVSDNNHANSPLEVTLMTQIDKHLLIDILNTLDPKNSYQIILSNMKIEPFEFDKFKFSYIEDNIEKFIFGQHPVNGNKNLMLLEIPYIGKRILERKAGDSYRLYSQ